jgi:predicted permease
MRWPWNKVDSEIEREIAHHLHELASEFERRGHPKDEATRLARLEFGGQDQVTEECRDQSRWSWWFGFRQDMLFGWRMMRKAPVVTVAAVLSLALGIGANAAIGSLMDIALWRDLPLPAAHELTIVHWQGHGFPQGLATGVAGWMDEEDGLTVADFFSHAAFRAMKQSGEGRAELAAFTFPDTVSVSFEGRPAVAKQRPVSGSFFSTLRVNAALGRVLTEADDDAAAPATVVVSHAYWSREMGADPHVVGKTMRVNNRPHVVAGVLERNFYGLDPRDPTGLYTPLQHGAWLQRPMDGQKPLENDRFWCVSMIARRAPGVTDEQLKAAWTPAFRASWNGKPKEPKLTPHLRLEQGSRGLGGLRGQFKRPLLVLGALVGLLLIIACANIANLLLARAAARRREVAVRVSLGCTRSRLMRQFLTESAMLAALGGAAAVAVAYATGNLLGGFLGSRDTIPVSVALDWRLLLAIGTTTCVALLLFGVFPAWRGSRVDSVEALKQHAGAVGVASRRWWRSDRLLVLAQMAMSIVLVMAAVIFTRNLRGAESVDPGFERRNMVLFGVRPGVSGYNEKQLPGFYSNLEQRLAATPGVEAVGFASVRPMDIGGWWGPLWIDGKTNLGMTAVNSVTPGYLPIYAPRLMAGRGISAADVQSKAKVAVITEDVAKKMGEGPVLGRRISLSDRPEDGAVQVIGVVPSIASNSIKERPLAVWLPLEQDRVEVTVVLRTSGPPQAVLPGIRRAMEEIDAKLPMVDVVTMEEQISRNLQRERMFATLCGGLGVLALILSVVGLYGVMAYQTARRRGEIGIRLALGAKPGDVAAKVLREGMTTAMIGMAVGLVLVVSGARFLESELYKLKALDALSLTLAIGTLAAAAFFAVAAPAVRASRAHPLQALREE